MLIVLFDGGCPMCRRTVRLLRRLDWRRRLRFADGSDAVIRDRVAPGLAEAALLAEMVVVDAAGRRFHGFDGVVRIARVLPLTAPLAWLGLLPGLRQAGRSIYRGIAARRTRAGACTDDLCSPAFRR